MIATIFDVITGCGQSDYPELAQAKAFALQLVTDQLAEATAPDSQPMTDEAAWVPMADAATRVAIAQKYGPVKSLRRPRVPFRVRT